MRLVTAKLSLPLIALRAKPWADDDNTNVGVNLHVGEFYFWPPIRLI